MSHVTHTLTFDGVSGALLGRQSMSLAMQVQNFFAGFHMAQFQHWWLRWVYFLLGLGSCILIATGFLLWVEKRRARHVKSHQDGYRLVSAIGAAGTVGVIVSTLAMLVANKALPTGIQHQGTIEQGVFFAAWLGTALHALLRSVGPGRCTPLAAAWCEQGWAVALLAACAVMLNAVMTEHGLPVALVGLRSVTGVDLVLLVAALIAAVTARRFGNTA